MLQVEGFNELSKALKLVGDKLEDGFRDVVGITADQVLADAVKSIQKGNKTGSVYDYISDGEGTVIERDGKFMMFINKGMTNRTHRASAPGEAPASDTGELAGSITAIKRGLYAFVGTPKLYGGYLEFGTRKIAERPFMRPARENNAKPFYSMIKNEIKKVTT